MITLDCLHCLIRRELLLFKPLVFKQILTISFLLRCRDQGDRKKEIQLDEWTLLLIYPCLNKIIIWKKNFFCNFKLRGNYILLRTRRLKVILKHLKIVSFNNRTISIGT